MKFTDYLLKREYQEPFMSRLGGAIGAGLGAAKERMGRKTLTSPAADDFHTAELDMIAVRSLADKIKSPAIKKAAEEFSNRISRWVYEKYR